LLSNVSFIDEKDDVIDAAFFSTETPSTLVKDAFLCILGTKEFCNIYRLVGYTVRLYFYTNCEESAASYKFDMLAGDFVFRDIQTGEVVISEKDFN
jgi:hypothetical protein